MSKNLENIKIAGLEPSSMLEREGYISAIVFLMGCNFKCPFCHNPELIKDEKGEIVFYPISELLKDLYKKKGWVDNVILTGGEPTLYSNLDEFIKEIKKMGFDVGIHTNGTNPDLLKKLIDEKLLSYIAMDIKSSEEKYAETVGLKKININKIKRSIELIKKAKDNSDIVFRTTVVPGLVDMEDIKGIGELLKGAKVASLQQFRPMKCLDKKYEKLEPYNVQHLHKMADMLENYVEEVKREYI